MSDVLELGKKRAKELGLSTCAYGTYYPAEIIHRLLGEGVETKAWVSKEGLAAPCWIARPWNDADATHTAIMIAIRPITKPDTAESLLKDFTQAKTISLADYERLIERAKAYLEKGEK